MDDSREGSTADRPSELPLVAVIIPAYNAAKTIEETLISVRSQTYKWLEILVVDDGSSDATLDIVARHSAADGRIRVLRQANAGVAAARNNAIGQARAELVAPVDADDLWSADKIERQVHAYLAGGPQTALVYNWFATIDPESRVTGLVAAGAESGRVFRQLLAQNFIGNGSTPLMRKSVVIACGGYDSGLHLQGAQGCEDLKLYLAIAENHDFAVVPDYLTGYRITPGNMSSNSDRMMRSFDLVTEPIAQKYPQYRHIVNASAAFTLLWHSRNRWRSGGRREAISLAMRGFARCPQTAIHYYLVYWTGTKARNIARRLGLLRHRSHMTGKAGRPIAVGQTFSIGTVAPSGHGE